MPIAPSAWTNAATIRTRMNPICPPLPVVRLDTLRELAVDDEPDARRLIVELLEEAGAVVTSVSSATEAIAAFAGSNPEVLVSDLGMPDQDGFELMRQIRARGYHAKGLPAVALRLQAMLAGFQIPNADEFWRCCEFHTSRSFNHNHVVLSAFEAASLPGDYDHDGTANTWPPSGTACVASISQCYNGELRGQLLGHGTTPSEMMVKCENILAVFHISCNPRVVEGSVCTRRNAPVRQANAGASDSFGDLQWLRIPRGQLDLQSESPARCKDRTEILKLVDARETRQQPTLMTRLFLSTNSRTGTFSSGVPGCP